MTNEASKYIIELHNKNPRAFISAGFEFTPEAKFNSIIIDADEITEEQFDALSQFSRNGAPEIQIHKNLKQ